MHRFKNILFSPLGRKDNPAALRRIAALAQSDDAALTLFGVVREPTRFQRLLHDRSTTDGLLDAARHDMSTRLERWGSGVGVPVATALVTSTGEASAIVEQVVRGRHDLVVVTTDEDHEDHATIRQLLRECPCPVWVTRPTRARVQRVLAAVDLEPDQEGLNHLILELAASMNGLYGGELHLVHSWELYGESTMRSSAFMHVPAGELHEMRQAERLLRDDTLRQLLASSMVAASPWEIHLEHGSPARVIPELVTKRRINVVVMGTVARTGLNALAMGNTAERILDQVRCSVIALKPPG